VRKAADDLKKQKELEATDKQHVVDSRVPKLEIAGLKTGALLTLSVHCYVFMTDSSISACGRNVLTALRSMHPIIKESFVYQY